MRNVSAPFGALHLKAKQQRHHQSSFKSLVNSEPHLPEKDQLKLAQVDFMSTVCKIDLTLLHLRTGLYGETPQKKGEICKEDEYK